MNQPGANGSGGSIDPKLAMAMGALSNMGATRDIGGGYRQRDNTAMLRGAAGAGMQAFQDRARMQDVAAQREQENEMRRVDRVRNDYQRQQQAGREDLRYADMVARQDRTDAQQNANRVEDNMRRELAAIDQSQYRANAAADDRSRYELDRTDRLAELAQKQTALAGGADGLSRPGALQNMTNRTLADIGTNQIKGDLALSRFAAGPEGIAKPTSLSTAGVTGATEAEWYDARAALMADNDEEPSRDAIKAEIIRRKLGRTQMPGRAIWGAGDINNPNLKRLTGE